MVATTRTPTPTTSVHAVALDQVSKIYGKGQNEVVALDGVSIAFPHGTFTAIMGPSGSGKSTLLHCAAGLDQPTSGTVTLAGMPISSLKESELTVLRRDRIGFVFQSFNLLPALNVWQNVALPFKLAGTKPDKAGITRILNSVGLGDRLRHRPNELSNGQQQRVAIARALATRPAVMFADEPTGALDTSTARDVLRLLQESVRTTGQTVVMVTHDPVAASYADQVVFLADGRLAGGLSHPTPDAVAKCMTQLGSHVAARRAAAVPSGGF